MTTEPGPQPQPLTVADAGEVLTLQRAAYVTGAYALVHLVKRSPG
jgi:hypothetical protein